MRAISRFKTCHSHVLRAHPAFTPQEHSLACTLQNSHASACAIQNGHTSEARINPSMGLLSGMPDHGIHAFESLTRVAVSDSSGT